MSTPSDLLIHTPNGSLPLYVGILHILRRNEPKPNENYGARTFLDQKIVIFTVARPLLSLVQLFSLFVIWICFCTYQMDSNAHLTRGKTITFYRGQQRSNKGDKFIFFEIVNCNRNCYTAQMVWYALKKHKPRKLLINFC